MIRHTRPVLRWLLFASLSLVIFLPGSAAGQEEGLLAGVSPAPLSGAGAVNFVSQAVDSTLRRAEDGLYLTDSEAVVRLHNTDRFNVAAIRLGWPGWPGGNLRFHPGQLLGFAPVKGDQRLPAELQTMPTTWGGEQRDSDWLVTQTEIGRDSRERIFFNWSQSHGTGPLLTYTFGLVPASAWAGTVGSARVTLHLPDYASAEMIVSAQPSDYIFSGRSIEWLLVDLEPTVNPTVTFVAPHLWREIEASRAAVGSDPFGANMRLSELYQQLAAAGISEYEAEAEAALEAAKRANPADPTPLSRLAALYRERAAQEGGNLATLEQAVVAAEAAFAAGLNDEVGREALIADLQTLASAWAERDPAVALDFYVRAENASGESGRFAEQRRPLAERLALDTLQRGSVNDALAVAEQYGLPTTVRAFPWLTSASVAILNTAGGRTIQLDATGDEALLADRFGGLATRLTASGYPATWDGNTLTIEVPGSEEDWLRGSRTIAASLGEEPEWDLLRDVMQPAQLQYRTAEDTLEVRFGYREQIAVETRALALANELRSEANARASTWEQALLNEAADRWQSLYDSQSLRVTTSFDAAGQSVQRSWSLSLPVSETLEWRGEAPRRERWIGAGAAVALGLLLLLGLIWLPGRRARRHPARR